MTIICNNYQDAYDELMRIASEAYDLGNLDAWGEANDNTERLKRWIDGGKPDPCPVNLESHGIEVKNQNTTDLSEVRSQDADLRQDDDAGSAQIRGDNNYSSRSIIGVDEEDLTGEGVNESIEKHSEYDDEYDKLRSTKETWESAKEKLEQGVETYYSSELDEYIPIEEYVEEVHRSYEEISNQTAQLQLRKAQIEFSDSPESAKELLVKELDLPLLPEHAKALHEELEKIIGKINSKAEKKISGEKRHIESPEQYALRGQLEEARDYFDAGQYKQTMNLSSQIKELAEDNTLRNAAVDLYDQAQLLFTAALQEALNNGDEARQAGDEDSARQYYKQAQMLDNENKHARRALIELNGVLDADGISNTEILRLRAGLKQRRDPQKLGEAVYTAEALDAEGKLDRYGEDFPELLETGRKYYDDIRIEMGQETTMARFGDLKAKREAWELAREKLIQGVETYYHSVLNRWVPTPEYVEEANRLYEEKSAETATYELDIARSSLPDNPKGASDRLSTALELPFLSQHVDELEKEYQKVQSQIQAKQEAQEKLEQAAHSDDPLIIFNLVSQAHEIFPYIKGLDTRLSQARQTALDTLDFRMKTHHNKVDVLIKADTHEAYDLARKAVENAEEIATRWPEEKIPEILKNRVEAGRKLINKVNARQTLRNEFEQRVEVIHQQVSDPNRRQSGRRLFQDLREDERFSDFNEMRTLISEMDQYAGLGEQLAEARAEKEKGNWERVYELAEKLKMSGKAGQFSKEVDELFSQSVIELEIIRVGQLIQQKDFIEAETVLDLILSKAKNDDQLNEYKARLQEELEQLETFKSNTAPMQELFDNALGKMGLLGNSFVRIFLNHQLDKSGAIKNIPGISNTNLKQIVSVLSRSSNSQISIQEGMEAADQILMKHLASRSVQDRIQALQIFRYIQGNPLMIENTWPEYCLSYISNEAGKMARLLTKSIRKDILEPLQNAYLSRESDELDAKQLQRFSQNARSLRDSNLLENEYEREAARWFDVEQGKREAEGEQKKGNWSVAVTIWKELNLRHPGDREVQEDLLYAQQKEDAINSIFNEVDKLVEGGGHLQAIRVILRALSSGITKNEPHLQRKVDEVYQQSQTELLGIAEEEGKKFDEHSISHAVVILHELGAIEELYDVPEPERVSKTALVRIHSRLEDSHPDLADQFDKLGELYKLLQEADALQFERQVTKLGDTVALEKSSTTKDTKWDLAIRTGNFTELERYWQLINELDLVNNPMAIDFKVQLEEYKAAYQKLAQDIKTIIMKFSGEENFSSVLEILRNNTLLPQEYHWTRLQQGDYQHIRQLMSDRMIVVDAYGTSQNKSIMGWENVERVAKLRKEELRIWQTWHKDCENLIINAQSMIEVVGTMTTSHSLVEQQEAHEKVCQSAIRAIETLRIGPEQNGESVKVHSRDVSQIQEQGIEWLDKAKKILIRSFGELEKVISSILTKGGFPTPIEFQQAAMRASNGDSYGLNLLIERSNLIGPGNSILSESDFRFVAVQASKGNLSPLKQLLQCIDLMNIEDFPTMKDVDRITSDGQNVEKSSIENLITQIESGISFIEQFRSAKSKALNGQYQDMKGFLDYSERIRSMRLKDEGGRLKMYANTLNQTKTKKLTIFDWIRKLFGG